MKECPEACFPYKTFMYDMSTLRCVLLAGAVLGSGYTVHMSWDWEAASGNTLPLQQQ